MTQPAQASWSCEYCSRDFGRKEHLERHMHRHSQLKPFRCTLCTESFARKDTLLRHSTVHGERGDEIRQHLANQSKRRAQACHNCAKSKQRCQGTFPCNRCIKKDLTCRIKTTQPNSRLRDSNRSVSHDFEGQSATSTPLETSAIITPFHVDPPEPETGSPVLTPTPQPTTIIGSNVSREEVTIPDCLTGPDDGFAIPSQENHPIHAENDTLLSADFDYQMQAQEDITHDAHYGTDTWSTDFSSLFMSPLLWTSCLEDSYQEDSLTQRNREILTNEHLPTSITGDPDIQRGEPIAEQIIETEPTSVTNDILQGHHETPAFRITPADEVIVACENFCYVNQVNPTSYSFCEQFHAQLEDTRKSPLPSIRVMHAFVELYFEYFDKDFPCIHPSQLEQDDASWILLFAVTSVGAQYSALSGADEHVRGLQVLLEQAVKENIPPYSRNASLCFVQSVLIRDINRSFSGLRSQQTKLEYERNLLLTLQRALKPRHQTSHQESNAHMDHAADDWETWFSMEATTRLNLCINRLQILQFALFDLKPVVRDFSVSQLPLRLTTRWTCRNDEEWSRRRHLSLAHTEAQKYSEVTYLMASISVERIQRIDRISDKSLARHLQNSNSNSYAHTASAFMWSNVMQPMDHRSGFSSPLVNGALNKLLNDFTTRRANGEPGGCADYLLHIMAILRHVPLRAIHAYSGWEANEIEIEEAEMFLSNWMRDHPRSVRTCLWHASSSLRILRNKSQFSCSDPFVVLIAGLIIWTYCKLGLCADDTIHGVEHQSHTGRITPTRIDQLSDEVEINTWIKGENPAIHLTGFGALTGPGSAHRVTAELERILCSKTGWKVLRHGLAYNFRQVASGERPAMPEE